MNVMEQLEEVLDERRNYLCECNKVYFMADLEAQIPEKEQSEDDDSDEAIDLSKSDEQYMMLEPCNRDFHYMDAENLLYGLAEYLDKDTEGLDKNDVPLIAYEVTDDNKLLFTCYINADIDLCSKPDEDYDEYKELNIIQRLEKFLNGQISDGWGENGLFLYYFMGCPAIIAYAKNLKQVEKKYKRFLDWEWSVVE